MLLHKGQIVDSFQGLLPDAELKAWVDKAVKLAGGPAVGAKALEEAAALLDGGDVPGATQAYAALMSLPELAAAAAATAAATTVAAAATVAELSARQRWHMGKGLAILPKNRKRKTSKKVDANQQNREF